MPVAKIVTIHYYILMSTLPIPPNKPKGVVTCPYPGGRAMLGEAECKMMVAMKLAGWSYVDIAGYFGVARFTVTNKIAKMSELLGVATQVDKLNKTDPRQAKTVRLHKPPVSLAPAQVAPTKAVVPSHTPAEIFIDPLEDLALGVAVTTWPPDVAPKPSPLVAVPDGQVVVPFVGGAPLDQSDTSANGILANKVQQALDTALDLINRPGVLENMASHKLVDAVKDLTPVMRLLRNESTKNVSKQSLSQRISMIYTKKLQGPAGASASVVTQAPKKDEAA
jgi:hypothetical protein